MCNEDDLKRLSAILSLDPEAASAIKSIRAVPFMSSEERITFEFLKEKIKTITEVDNSFRSLAGEISTLMESNNSNTYIISAELYDQSYASSLEKGLLTFLVNDKYISKRIEDRRQTLEQRARKLSMELSALDSLKHLVNNNFLRLNQLTREGSNNVILSDKMGLDPISIYQKDLDIFNDLLSVKSELFLKNDFEVVSNMMVDERPANAGIIKSMILWAAVFLGIGYFTLALCAFNRYLSKLSSVG
jgi:hypothetical protein